MRRVLKEFRDFAFRGNMLDLAVGVIIGAAFGAVVNSLAKDVLLNFVAVLFGKPDFSAVVWRICRGTPARCTNIGIGNLLTALVDFLIVAFVLFLVIKAVNRMLSRPKAVEAKKTRDCPYCLTAIPLAASKCFACTSPVDPAPPPAAEPEPAPAG